MPLEIERKFIVKDMSFLSAASSSTHIRQGYLCSVPERTVRIRIQDESAFITIKGIGDAAGISRYEWEKQLDFAESLELFKLCEPGAIVKRRHLVPVGEHCYEVDVFEDKNLGLILAEIELSNPDEEFTRPAWLGKEVSGNDEYYNSALTRRPYTEWWDQLAIL
jgi:adenylate cyclase